MTSGFIENLETGEQSPKPREAAERETRNPQPCRRMHGFPFVFGDSGVQGEFINGGKKHQPVRQRGAESQDHDCRLKEADHTPPSHDRSDPRAGELVYQKAGPSLPAANAHRFRAMVNTITAAAKLHATSGLCKWRRNRHAAGRSEYNSGLNWNAAANSPWSKHCTLRIEPQPGQFRPVSEWTKQRG